MSKQHYYQIIIMNIVKYSQKNVDCVWLLVFPVFLLKKRFVQVLH